MTTAGLEPATFWYRKAIEAKRATIAPGSLMSVGTFGPTSLPDFTGELAKVYFLHLRPHTINKRGC